MVIGTNEKLVIFNKNHFDAFCRTIKFTNLPFLNVGLMCPK
jgi:hypothetical protein